MFEKSQEHVVAECEQIGESGVRIKLKSLTGGYSVNERAVAEEWLRLQEESLNSSRISLAERRAMRAEIIAAISAIAAIIAAIAAVMYAKP